MRNEVLERQPQKRFAVGYLVQIRPATLRIRLGFGGHVEHRLGAQKEPGPLAPHAAREPDEPVQ